MDEERGMKGFLPFASLIEHSKFVDQVEKEKQKISRPKISTEQAKKINTILSSYHGEYLHIKIFLDGRIYLYKGPIYLNKEKKVFSIKDYVLSLNSIIDIETPNIFDEIC